MAEEMNRDPGASGLFAQFVERLGLGLQVRVEGECRVVAPETEPVAHDELAGRLADGALVARIAWTLDGHEGSGCFLWLGDFGALLGGGDKPASGLSGAEVETLAQSLRINVQEGSEDGDFALQWTDPERVAADGLAAALREAGIEANAVGERHALQVGQERLTFLFLEAPFDAAATAPEAEETPPDDGRDPDPALTAANAPAASRVEPAAADEVISDASFLGGILDLPLSLQVRLGTTHMSLDELLHLIPGSVIELQQREEEPLEVLANGRVVARGEVVVVDERFGVRITEIVTSRERLAAV